MTEKVMILGADGMLGQLAAKFFAAKYEVIILNDRYIPSSRSKYIDKIIGLSPTAIINCVGKIKQKTSRFEDLIISNALLPLDLNGLPEHIIIINPSTDCVFSGANIQPYDFSFQPDAEDDYGLSKIYGELSSLRRKNSFIIRTSIIGLTKNNESAGLLDWFMKQPKNSSINGFTNHHWNGITTLEWCIIAESIIHDLRAGKVSSKTKNFFQVGAKNTVSKYELLEIANKVFNRNLTIIPTIAPQTINRALLPTVKIDSVLEQLERYAKWMN